MIFLFAAINSTFLTLNNVNGFKRVIKIVNVWTRCGDLNKIQPPLIVSPYGYFGKYMI